MFQILIRDQSKERKKLQDYKCMIFKWQHCSNLTTRRRICEGYLAISRMCVRERDHDVSERSQLGGATNTKMQEAITMGDRGSYIDTLILMHKHTQAHTVLVED